MQFEVGDLVWLSSACKDGYYHGPPAIVLAAYRDKPKIFLCNPAANNHMLEDEDLGAGIVYDILWNGEIEIAVLGEWLEPMGDWLQPFIDLQEGKKRGPVKAPQF